MRAVDIARVCHEANRAVQHATGDPVPSPAWNDAPKDQRESAIHGVKAALDGATPEELHQSWLSEKHAAGWVWGPTKDAAKKTHPCMVMYSALPEAQRIKDYVFQAIVNTLAKLDAETTPPTATAQEPSVGRIVHYQSFGTPGGEYLPEPRAAIITAVPDSAWGRANQGLSLCVLNPEGTYFNQHVPYANTPMPGHWNWPPRT